MPGLSFLSKKKWHTEQQAKERIIDEKSAIEEIQLKLAKPAKDSDDHGKSEVRFLYECPNEKINQLDAMNKRSLENGIIIEDPLVIEFKNKLENVRSERDVDNDKYIEQTEVVKEVVQGKSHKKSRRRNSAIDPLDYINEMLNSIDNDDFGDLDVHLIATLQKNKQKKLLKRILEIEKGNDK